MKKILVAFSGGLDTSYCVLFLKKQGYGVITLTVDTGGMSKKEAASIANQAKNAGSDTHLFIDAKKDFYTTCIAFIIKGNLLRGGVYPLCAGPERVVIAEKLAEVARKEQVIAIAHGSTGAGNDQIRFAVALRILAPQIKILAPIRDTGITREQEILCLKQAGIPVQETTKRYSFNKNLLGTTIGGKETKTSWETLPDSAYPTVAPIEKTPDKGETLVISFVQGLPTMIQNKKLSGVAIMQQLNLLGARHGIGKGVHLGTTIVGIKGRVGFEAPAATILIKAHTELEKLVLTQAQLSWKETLCHAYADLLHTGLYFDPVVNDMEAFIDNTQQYVTGDVHVKLYKGNCVIEGVRSPYSLMDTARATYGEASSLWTGTDAKGFAKIYGLQSMLAAHAHKKGLL